MSNMLPSGRPQLTKTDAERLLATYDLVKYPVRILGIRGYFQKTMGKTPSNDVGIYDDALFIVAPSYFKSFNANTDPSRIFKDVAVLKAGGPYLYKIGMHGVSGPHPYLALRQNGNVTVIRNGTTEITDNPSRRFYIDIHRGGYNTTSSLGCQTIHPDQWEEFFDAVNAQLKANNQTIISYILIEQK
jgi:lysozyme